MWGTEVEGYHRAALWPEASHFPLTFLDKQQESWRPRLRDQALHRVPEPEGMAVNISLHVPTPPSGRRGAAVPRGAGEVPDLR